MLGNISVDFLPRFRCPKNERIDLLVILIKLIHSVLAPFYFPMGTQMIQETGLVSNRTEHRCALKSCMLYV